ncbi:hypothetical protein [Micromonospora sp. C41]|uniref:hypothetical protein n=1 Tax=Micromonospora sp. C41 TaxID=2824878 RepID=UPI001B373A65|nr:hypothetical protein [Micromonospora sp. C41]MBQ1062288.1 hypothetical protein [Micromonospora sp. C41]
MASSAPVWVSFLLSGLVVAGSIVTTVLTLSSSKRREVERWQRERAREDERWERERDRENERWERERDMDTLRWDRQKVEQLRQRRVTLYVDMADHLQRCESSLDVITDPYGVTPSRRREGLAHPEQLAAQARLLAPESLSSAWLAFDRAENAVGFVLRESPDGIGPEHHPYLHEDNLAILELKDAMTVLHRELRVAIADPDLTD